MTEILAYHKLMQCLQVIKLLIFIKYIIIILKLSQGNISRLKMCTTIAYIAISIIPNHLICINDKS